MSGQPVSTDQHPPHGHPDNKGPSTVGVDKASTSSHPPSFKPDPTTSATQDAAQRGFAASPPSPAAQLASLQMRLRSALKQYPDFPEPGILFEDILPIFADPSLHEDLIHALDLHVRTSFGDKQKPEVVVALEARGFLFGPALALRLGAAFVPIRKKGKLPGRTETTTYKKEYGEDVFQIQADAIKSGQRVVVVDDLIATGESATAAGELVKKAGGNLLEYIFVIGLDFLKGSQKLDAPVYTLLLSQTQDG